MRGHEEASGTKYVPKELFDEWEEKDPIKNFEHWLLQERILSGEEIEQIRQEQKQKIEEELKWTNDNKPAVVSVAKEVRDVYAPSTVNSQRLTVNQQPSHTLRFIDAIKQGMHQSMQQHPNLILMGQDIAGYGGAFKITEGFVEEFGKERVRNTPL